jgi:hypothetical protein
VLREVAWTLEAAIRRRSRRYQHPTTARSAPVASPAVEGFWVGIPGDVTPQQQETLASAGLSVKGQLRTMVTARDRSAEWKTLRTFVPVAGEEQEAKACVAAALGLDVADLAAYSADVFQ